MAGEARPSPAYYIALGLLVVGLVTGLSLFLLLTTRPHSDSASVDFSVEPTRCPDGSGGTSCYLYTVTNTGNRTVFVSCSLTPANGTQATFADGDKVRNFDLVDGQSSQLLVSVTRDQGSTLEQPSMSCPATPV
jgi:hypothetical protein